MVTKLLARRILALGVCASVGLFTTAVVAGPAFAKSKSKGKKHHTTTTTKKGKKSSTSKGSTTLATELKKLETNVKGQKQATFIATYKLTTGGSTKSITFAQQPPKSLFKTTSGTIIDNGKTTFYCSDTGAGAGTTTPTASTGGSAQTGGTTCIKSTTADPLAGMLDLFSGTEALSFFNEAEEEGAAKAAGYTVSFSSGTYGGLASKCVSVSKGSTSQGKYCVANVGILDYWSDGTNGASLVKYSSSVPSGTFTPPAGATVVTEPTV